jgi:hypothetical protein
MGEGEGDGAGVEVGVAAGLTVARGTASSSGAGEPPPRLPASTQTAAPAKTTRAAVASTHFQRARPGIHVTFCLLLQWQDRPAG